MDISVNFDTCIHRVTPLSNILFVLGTTLVYAVIVSNLPFFIFLLYLIMLERFTYSTNYQWTRIFFLFFKHRVCIPLVFMWSTLRIFPHQFGWFIPIHVCCHCFNFLCVITILTFQPGWASLLILCFTCQHCPWMCSYKCLEFHQFSEFRQFPTSSIWHMNRRSFRTFWHFNCHSFFDFLWHFNKSCISQFDIFGHREGCLLLFVQGSPLLATRQLRIGIRVRMRYCW